MAPRPADRHHGSPPSAKRTGAPLETHVAPALIPCISIRQPWAWLIVRPDLSDHEERRIASEHGHIKDIENRSWPTTKRGPILIHAAKAYSRREHSSMSEHLATKMGIELPSYETMQRGGIVGRATLTDSVREHPSPWKIPDQWGFVLEDSAATPFVPWRGQLGWFLVPSETILPNLPEDPQKPLSFACTPAL